MSRRKIPASSDSRAEDARLVELLRLETRVESVPLTDEEKVERLTSCAGLEAEISELERDQTDLDEQRKALKTSIDAKIAQFRAAVREADAGHKGAEYSVLVERHPDRAVEMMVWRIPTGIELDVALDLSNEKPAEGETVIQLRERQGCLLVETRAMSPDEVRAADIADDKHRAPMLPLEGLDAPTAPTGDAAPEGETGETEEGKPGPAPIDPFASAPNPDGKPLEEGDPLTGEPLFPAASTRLSDLDDDAWVADPPKHPDEQPKGKRGRKAKA